MELLVLLPFPRRLDPVSRAVALAIVVAVAAGACGTSGESVEAPPLVTRPPDPTPTEPAASTDPSSTTTGAPTSSTAPLPDLPEVTIEQVECPAEIRTGDLSCGLATVPLDRDDPASGTTTISLAALLGRDADAAVPMAVLQGGPGGSSTGLTTFYPQRAFPQVFIDQRGTGFGDSDFDCPEVDRALTEVLEATSPVGERIELAAYEECADRLTGDRVLENTDTATHADDVVDVMAALGYENWFVYGVSYGTTIALQIMRDSPSALDGAVLDSVYPIDLDIDAAIVESSASSLAELDLACAVDPRCDEILSDVSGTVDALIARLDADPLTVELDADETLLGEDLDVVVDGETLAGTVFRFLYDEGRFRFLPGMLDGLERGDPATERWTARVIVDMFVSSLLSNDDGTWFAVQCADRLPFTAGPPVDLSAYEAAMAEPPLSELCEPWARSPSPPSLARPVTSDIPALLLGGQFDPITPPSFALRVAEELQNATVAIRPGLGHGVWFGDDCASRLVDAFVDDPGAVLDTTCAAVPDPVDWRRPTGG